MEECKKVEISAGRTERSRGGKHMLNGDKYV